MKHLEFTGEAVEARERALLRASQLVSRGSEPQAGFPVKLLLFPLGSAWHGPC